MPGVPAAAFTRWDVRVLARAAGAATVALGLAWLVTAATDEGGVAWGERAGRALPLAPLCAAIGTWLALAPARSRGETRALAALGRSRWQVAAAAAAGGALVALVAAAAMGVVRRVDVGGFYPTATHATRWEREGDAFVDRDHGLRVGADGAPVALQIGASGEASASEAIPPLGRTAAVTATALAGAALPLLLAHALLSRPSEPTRRHDRAAARSESTAAVAVLASLSASLVLFQAAAVHRAHAMLAALPALALLVFAIRRYRSSP